MANLTQLKILEELNGLLLVDKPAGIAFSTVIKTVKRKFNLVKVGHGGSLDTASSGLMILLLNDANRYVGEIMGADRFYKGTMRLGMATNTHDSHGAIVAEKPIPEDIDAMIEKTLPEFKGDVFQTESRWCTVRRDVSHEYEVADTGEHKPFLAHVYKFDVERFEGNKFSFSVSATKGLIVRTLVNDFGEALGCGAVLEDLRRVKVGRWMLDEAVRFDKLLEAEMGDLPKFVKPFVKNF